MKTFKVWVDRSELSREFFTIEAKSLDDALAMAEGGDVNPEETKHTFGEVIDSGEQPREIKEDKAPWPGFTYPDPDSAGLISSVEDLLK